MRRLARPASVKWRADWRQDGRHCWRRASWRGEALQRSIGTSQALLEARTSPTLKPAASASWAWVSPAIRRNRPIAAPSSDTTALRSSSYGSTIGWCAMGFLNEF
jgi:hypothetical protein